MSQLNPTITDKLLNAKCIDDLKSLAQGREDESNPKTLSILIDAETRIGAFVSALQAVGRSLRIAVDVGYTNEVEAIPGRAFESGAVTAVLVLTEDLPICKRLYGVEFAQKTPEDRVNLAQEIITCIAERTADLRRRYPNAAVLLQTLPFPLIPPAGIQDGFDSHGLDLTLLRLNTRLVEWGIGQRENNIFVVGHHRYSTTITRQFFDDTAWESLPPDQQSVDLGNVLTPAWELFHWLYPLVAQRSKALALDLDDTLWAGTLAEDGVEALKMGADRPGYDHHRIQAHCHALSLQGVMLGIVSRNQPEAVRVTLEELARKNSFCLPSAHLEAHPYDTKCSLIAAMCRYFDNILPSSVVFIDNSDIERELVAASGIGCTIAPFPNNVQLFERMFLHLPMVEKLNINGADKERHRWYAETQARHVSFDLTVVCDPADARVVDRVHELTQKTNQFNLTTIRYSKQDLLDLIADPHAHVFAFTAVPPPDVAIRPDVFAVIITRSLSSDKWSVESFLMSCRYMALGLDERAMKLVAQQAMAENVKYILGKYIPSDRNALVKDWYVGMNFLPTDAGAGVYAYRARAKDIIRKPSGRTSISDLQTYLEQHICLQSNPTIETRKRNIDCSIEVLVPSGVFNKGLSATEAEFIRGVFGLYPAIEVDQGVATVAPFWIDKYCITNAQFAEFMNSRYLSADDRQEFLFTILAAQPLCQLEFDGSAQVVYARSEVQMLPVAVPRRQAQEYAEWAGGRLPTEDEWEWAARGPDGRWFPWGNVVPSPLTVWVRSECPGPVDTCPASESPFGLRNMTGNVWQWCGTDYKGRPQYRGGDYRFDSAYYNRTTIRPIEPAEHCGNVVGFRVVRPLFSPEAGSH